MTIDTRYFLDNLKIIYLKPFLYRNKTFYCDGFKVLCLPKNDQYKEIEKEHKLKEFLDAFLDDIDNTDRDFFTLPDIEIPEPEICDECKGTGLLIEKNCPECEGSGEVEWDSDFNTYYDVCKSCDGSGVLLIPGKGKTCVYCNGIKSRFHEKYPVYVDGFKVDAAFLYPIKDEPNLKLSISSNKTALLFYTDDAKGLIMGMQ